MEMKSYEHGVPSWVDIGTPDLDAAVAFYSGLFGWDCQAGPPETGGYTLAHLRDHLVAGLGPQQNPEAPPTWAVYINVDEVEPVQKLVEENGGTTLFGPLDVMEQGRMAIFTDPTGGVFGVWQAGTTTGAELVNEPGTFSWAELITTDTEVTERFYQAVFGWGVRKSEGPMPYAEWQLNGKSVGGSMPKPPGMPDEVPTYWGVYFAVADIDLSIGRLRDLGGTTLMDAMETPAGRFVTAVDPTGGMFNLIQLAPRYADQ